MTQPLIAYVRVSRKGDREDERFHSPREQADRARSFALGKGYTVGEVVEDIDVSGGTHPSERPGMAHALDAIRAGEAGGLVAYSLDRLSRDPAHGDWLVREVTQAGGVVLAPDIPEDITSPAGEFTFGMLLQVAKLYRSTAKVRFAGAVERSIHAGIPVGQPPFGYRRGEGRVLEIEPAQAELVRELFARRVQGEGATALARWMTERSDRQWSRQSVSFLLTQTVYRTGRITHGDLVSEHDAGAIVEPEQWFAAQRPSEKRDGRTAKGKWLLSGLLRCASCGHALKPWRPARGERRTTANRYNCGNPACTSRVSVHAEIAEEMIVAEAFARSMQLVAKPTEVAEIASLEQAYVDAERRFVQIATQEMQDSLGELWPEAVRERREARDEAARALGAARSEAGVTESGPTLNLGWIWHDLEGEQQREALRSIFAEVRASRVPRVGGPKAATPALEYVPANRRHFRIEYRPVEIERQS